MMGSDSKECSLSDGGIRFLDESENLFAWVVEQGEKSLPLDNIDRIEVRVYLLPGIDGERVFAVLKNGDGWSFLR